MKFSQSILAMLVMVLSSTLSMGLEDGRTMDLDELSDVIDVARGVRELRIQNDETPLSDEEVNEVIAKFYEDTEDEDEEDEEEDMPRDLRRKKKSNARGQKKASIPPGEKIGRQRPKIDVTKILRLAGINPRKAEVVARVIKRLFPVFVVLFYKPCGNVATFMDALEAVPIEQLQGFCPQFPTLGEGEEVVTDCGMKTTITDGNMVCNSIFATVDALFAQFPFRKEPPKCLEACEIWYGTYCTGCGSSGKSPSNGVKKNPPPIKTGLSPEELAEQKAKIEAAKKKAEEEKAKKKAEKAKKQAERKKEQDAKKKEQNKPGFKTGNKPEEKPVNEPGSGSGQLSEQKAKIEAAKKKAEEEKAQKKAEQAKKQAEKKAEQAKKQAEKKAEQAKKQAEKKAEQAKKQAEKKAEQEARKKEQEASSTAQKAKELAAKQKAAIQAVKNKKKAAATPSPTASPTKAPTKAPTKKPKMMMLSKPKTKKFGGSSMKTIEESEPTKPKKTFGKLKLGKKNP